MDENRNDAPPYMIGTRTSYGEPFLKYLDERGIGWVVCWFDDEWKPPMYTRGWADLTNTEDVTQNTLTTAWRTAHNFRCKGRLTAWLLGVVHHTAMKVIRSTSHQLDQAADKTVASQQPSPEERAQCQETIQWVDEGLRALSLGRDFTRKTFPDLTLLTLNSQPVEHSLQK